MLSLAERTELLQIAREAIASRLMAGDSRPRAAESTIARTGGAFVTLKRGQELRGCIGSLEMSEPLVGVVARCAVAASTEDPRFPALTAEELDQVSIEISVLGPLECVETIAEIEIGRHGLVVEQGLRRGLLLPQVAVEYAWDRETFLSHTCLKAGLRSDAWKSGANTYKFEAEVFCEEMSAPPVSTARNTSP